MQADGFSVRGGYADHLLHLELEPRQCLHLYFYCFHQRFGFMHLRLQTWFPFQVDLCLNGREWLCRELDAQGIAYRRQANCVVQVEDWARAQALRDAQAYLDWPKELEKLLSQFHPLWKEICRPFDHHYYWSVSESEYATDLVFRNARVLAQLYPQWVRHAITTFGCTDVMRYLGRRLPTQGGRVPSHFQGEVISDLKERLEGTMNHPEPFRSYRRLEGQPKSPKAWRSLRRSVADLPRRAEVSRAINARYAAALASTTQATSVAEAAAVVCRPVRHQGRRYRGLNPYGLEDAALLEAVSSADFVVAGLRNRDLQARLFSGNRISQAERRRRSGRITRRLALLRAHGLRRKVTGTHRYWLTPKGRTVITALLAARQASVDQLNKLAA